MMTSALAVPRVWAGERRGWRLPVLMPRAADISRERRAVDQYRLQQDEVAARRDLERQWGALLLDRQLLNG